MNRISTLQHSTRVGALNVCRMLGDIAHQANTLANNLRAFNALPTSPSFPTVFAWHREVITALDKMHDDLAKLALVAARAATKDLLPTSTQDI